MNTKNTLSYPLDLEPRFQPPPGWQWQYFKNKDGKTLRFGSIMPETGTPSAIVVCLGGLAEFAEKYFETARDMLQWNLGFYFLDWQGQGKSERHLQDRQKRHASSFSDDITDLHFFITEHVKPASRLTGGKHLPLVMLAHSMGANIGLRYLHQHPDTFKCAGFTAPMLGIQAVKSLPSIITMPLITVLNAAFGQKYVGFSGGPWREDMRSRKDHDIHSSDPIRKLVHNKWCLHDPELQVGDITFGWLYEAINSCEKLKDPTILEAIKTPCLFGMASQEALVDNEAMKRAAKIMPHAKALELTDSKHEIFMEMDKTRNVFMHHLQDLINESGIKTK